MVDPSKENLPLTFSAASPVALTSVFIDRIMRENRPPDDVAPSVAFSTSFSASASLACAFSSAVTASLVAFDARA